MSKKSFVLVTTLVFLSAFLALALALGIIFWGELTSGREVTSSVRAVYIADSGIEEVLSTRTRPEGLGVPSGCQCPNFCPLFGGKYCAQIKNAGEGGCTAENFCIKAVGEYGGTRRSIEVSF
jgi:hypothetical protein